MFKKIKKRILGFALKILKSYFEDINYSVLIFDRDRKEISPLLWHPRYLPSKATTHRTSATNDWSNFEDLFSYKESIVFDVGAAVGATSRIFCKDAKIVYSFEPNLENFNTLKDIIYLERITNIKPFNVAVSNQNSVLKFHNRESHGVHSLGKHPKGKVLKTTEIQSIRLDDFYQNNFHNGETIGLLKIDTEGFEYEVLKGSENLLKIKAIKCILFEHSKSILNSLGKNPDAIFKLLEEYQYEVYDYTGNSFNYKKDNYSKISDFIALVS